MSSLKVLRDAKRAGLSAQEAMQIIKNSTLKTAREEGWRASETAMTLVDRQNELRKVYGKKATEFLNG